MRSNEGPPWRWRCYCDHRGVDQIDRWLRNKSVKARAKFQRHREHLAQQPRTEWGRPHASPPGDHIYVIRFADENQTQWRVFGHFHDTGSWFVMTTTGTERDGTYDPKNYAALCLDRRQKCDTDFGIATVECFRR